MPIDNKYLLSVIIPVYNVEKYLHQCMDSILASEEQNLEIIAINDGSTDNSLEILKSYNDPRLYVYSKQNEGLYKTWKYGVSLSHGDFLVFVDSDDYIDSRMFSRINELLSVKQYDLIQFNYKYVTPKGKLIEQRIKIEPGEYEGDSLEGLRRQLWQLHRIQSIPSTRWAKVYNSALLKSILPYTVNNAVMHEDNAIVHPFFAKTRSVLFDNDFLYYNRVLRAGSNCNTHGKEAQYFNDCVAVNKSFLENRAIFNFSDDFLNAHYFCTYRIRVIQAIREKLYGKAAEICTDNKFSELLDKAQTMDFDLKEKCKLFLIKHKLFTICRILLLINDKLKFA